MESTARELYIIEPSISQMPQKLKVAGYARVSSNSDDQLNSFSAQVNNYTNYITENKEWQFVEVYADEGISGVSLKKRNDFNRMIEDCRNGKIDRIVTKSHSRFGRNTLDNLTILRELKELGVSVYFEKENIDTAKIQGEMLVTLFSVFAQQESLNISQNVKKGIRMRMQNGTYVSSCPPYGYRLVDKNLVVCEYEATIIRKIFSGYLSGKSLQQICDALNDDNIDTKLTADKWKPNALSFILKNERYKGDMLLQKFYSEEIIPYNRHKNNGEKNKFYIENTHEPIVTDLTYELVNLLMKKQCNHNNNKSIYRPLDKKIICKNCDTIYRKKILHKKCYYVCRNHDRDKKNCNSIRLREESIYNSFIRMYNKLKLNYKHILIPYLQNLEKLQEISNKGNAKINELNKKIADKSEQICSMNELLNSDILDSALFIPQNDLLNKELAELKQEKSRLLSNNDSSSDIKNTEELIKSLENGPSKLTEFDENIFNSIVEKIKAHDDKKLEFVLKNNLIVKERL